MANMSFKANILPATSQGYNLGSSTQQWVVHGPIYSNGLYGTTNIDYGSSLPATAVEGQIFFQTTTAANYTVPPGGTAGYALVKLSDTDGDVGWQILQPELTAMTVNEIQSGSDATPKAMRADYLKTALSGLGGAGLTFIHNTTTGIVLKHTNSVSAKNSFASSSTTATANGGAITVTDIKYDTEGHITDSIDRTITLGLTTGYGDTTNPYASKTQNYVLAAPSTANGVPSFRALTTSDLPTGTWEAIGGGDIGKLNKGTTTSTFLSNSGEWLTPPGTYTLPKATTVILGGVTVGSGLAVNNDGNVSVDWSNAPVSSINGTTGVVVLSDLIIGTSHYNGSNTVTVAITDLGLSSPMTFRGVTDTTLIDGTNVSPINITSGGIIGSLTPAAGDVVLQRDDQVEFLYTGSAWTQLGIASSYSLAEHSHGNILNDGTMSTTADVATGDHLIIADASDYNRLVSGSTLTFDTSHPEAALSHAGTWVDYLQLDGGTMTGAIKTHGIIGELDYDYGEVLPTSATEGQLFFQISYSDEVDLRIPRGGTAGYSLVKNSSADGDLKWSRVIPTGGSAGYALIKNSNLDGDYGWGPAVPSGGTAGYALVKNSNLDGDASWQLISADDRVAKIGDTMTGNLTVDRSGVGEASVTVQSAAGDIYLFAQNSAQGKIGIYTHNSSSYGRYLFYMEQDGTIHAGDALYGAVWNDYAEFRQSDITQPGRVIKEKGDDTLSLTTERLERGCEIISDTFGFAIGESEKAKTPTAASGRVLAYPYESKDEFKKHIGWPVCSGPGGTVSIMTEEEEIKYPSRIIGTISAVPDYSTWFGGSDKDHPIPVDGRVWIRIR